MYKGFYVSEETIVGLTENCLYDDDVYDKYNYVLKELDKKSSDITSHIAKILKGDDSGAIDGEALQQACMLTHTNKYDVLSHIHI